MYADKVYSIPAYNIWSSNVDLLCFLPINFVCIPISYLGTRTIIVKYSADNCDANKNSNYYILFIFNEEFIHYSCHYCLTVTAENCTIVLPIHRYGIGMQVN